LVWEEGYGGGVLREEVIALLLIAFCCNSVASSEYDIRNQGIILDASVPAQQVVERSQQA
jgi:hypothetical protein